MNKDKLGSWAFFLGVVIAIVAGLIPTLIPAYWATLGLAILGLIIGVLNVTRKETSTFLLASVGLLVASAAGLNILPLIGNEVVAILQNIAALISPAVIVVALKAIWDTARKK
jgi:hypothetical protein